MPTRVRETAVAPVRAHVAAGPGATAAQGLAHELRRTIRGEVRFDAGSRALYATDASNYRHVPIGVVVPRDGEDVMNALTSCRKFDAPVLGRGGGTSLAGQCCNTAVVFDFSKYMHDVLEIDPAGRRARGIRRGRGGKIPPCRANASVAISATSESCSRNSSTPRIYTVTSARVVSTAGSISISPARPESRSSGPSCAKPPTWLSAMAGRSQLKTAMARPAESCSIGCSAGTCCRHSPSSSRSGIPGGG